MKTGFRRALLSIGVIFNVVVTEFAFGAIYVDNEQLARGHLFAGDARFQSVGAVRVQNANGSIGGGLGF